MSHARKADKVITARCDISYQVDVQSTKRQTKRAASTFGASGKAKITKAKQATRVGGRTFAGRPKSVKKIPCLQKPSSAGTGVHCGGSVDLE